MVFPRFVFLAGDLRPRDAVDFFPRVRADFVVLREPRDFAALFLPALFRVGRFFAEVFLAELFPPRAAVFVFFLEPLVDDRFAPGEVFLAAADFLLRAGLVFPTPRPAASFSASRARGS